MSISAYVQMSVVAAAGVRDLAIIVAVFAVAAAIAGFSPLKSER
jgi:hypothetical protein